MDLKILYQDQDVLALDKLANVVVFPEIQITSHTLIDDILERFPEVKQVGEAPRYGIVHRLDKDTSGVLLVAKTPEALIFLQKQFKNREVEKKYVALITGTIKEDSGKIHTLIGRSPADPRKQKAYPIDQTSATGKREAITTYKVIERFKDYTLLEVKIETGRKHQIRCHLAHIHHPVAGDTMYGFKDSPTPKGLTRQFLHASYIKIRLPDGKIKECNSDLPEEFKKIIK